MWDKYRRGIIIIIIVQIKYKKVVHWISMAKHIAINQKIKTSGQEQKSKLDFINETNDKRQIHTPGA